MRLTDRAALHPSLAPFLVPLVGAPPARDPQGVGYPDPNLSHFRSIEIWETASRSDQVLADGWLARAFGKRPVPASFAADGVVIGGNDLGPLAGGGTRAIALANPEQFLRRAKLAAPSGERRNAALTHILKTEGDIVQAAAHLDADGFTRVRNATFATRPRSATRSRPRRASSQTNPASRSSTCL